MKILDKITDLNLVYDKENKVFVEAYATLGANQVHITNKTDIMDLINAFKKQKGIKKLTEAKNDYFLVYANNNKMVDKIRNKYGIKTSNDVIKPNEYISNLSLNKNNPYNGATIKPKKKFWTTNKKIIAGVSVAVAGIVALGVALSGYNKTKNEAEVAIETVVEEKEVKEKIDPKTWEEYTESYVESEQKTLLTGEMDLITSNIITLNINDKEFKLALSPEELTAFNYYYNTFNMENDELVRTYGMYNMDHENSEDLINNVHDALDKVRFSMVKAEKVEDVLKLNFADEEAQELYDKYVKLIVEYNTASKKSKVKKEIEESLREDFIENGSINLKDHPAATVVLQLIPSTFNLQLSPLDDDLNVILVGTEVNVDVDGVKDTVQNNGLVDDACSVIDRRLEKADEYREQLQLRKESNESYNEMLLLTVNSNDELGQEYYDANYKVSELDTLTENTYDITGTMIPLMNNYLIENYEIDESIDYEELNEEMKESLIAELQAKQLNNTAKWDLRTNPSGGKVGDVIRGETVKGVAVSESQLTAQQVQEAQDKYYAAHPEIVEEEEQEKVQQNVTELCVQAYEAGQAETINAGSNAPINSKWANHEIANVRNAYNDGRANGIKVYNERQANNGTIVETPETGNDYGDHKDNPNQNGGQTGGETTTKEPVVQETPTEETPEVNEGEYGQHENNPNQGSGTTEVSIDDTDVIEGTMTTDDSNVDDMSQYGEVQTFSLQNTSTTEMTYEDFSSHENNPNQNSQADQSYDLTTAMINAMVEEMANPESPMNNVEEVQELSK